MAYVTWDYYKNTFHGGQTPQIAESEFPKYEAQSQLYIDNATLNKSKTYVEINNELKDCTCAIMDKYKAFDSEDQYKRAVGLTSEKVGEYSVSYGAQSIDDIKSKELYGKLKTYLGLTGLLFRGQNV